MHALVATFSKGPYGHVSDTMLPASVVGQAKEPFEVRMVWEVQGGAGVGVGMTLLVGEMTGEEVIWKEVVGRMVVVGTEV